MTAKPLNIGMIGYGFMGRAHTNGYKRVNDFFDLPYRPVLKAVCARDQAKAKAFAEQWGYESFEAYCLKELHIRKNTALKLTRSFSFLAKHESADVLKDEDFPQRAPAFEVVEVLADAADRGQLSPAEYRSLRDSIWNPEKPATELKKEFAERFPRPPPQPPPESLQVRRVAQARSLPPLSAGSGRNLVATRTRGCPTSAPPWTSAAPGRAGGSGPCLRGPHPGGRAPGSRG